MKDKNSGIRLMGFGHRVYKNYDPRAKVMQQTCHEVLEEARHERRSAAEGGAGAGARSRSATPTSSSASCIRTSTSIRASSCKAMGFPTSMFTVLFALARTVGWIAQWNEMIRGPAPEDRPSAPALHRRHAARLRRNRQAQVSAQSFGETSSKKAGAFAPAFFIS